MYFERKTPMCYNLLDYNIDIIFTS